MILLDTNILGRITDSTDPQCAAARRAVHRMLASRERLFIVPQNLYEFWAVATRRRGPSPTGQNGLGMSFNQASQWLRFFQRRFALLPDHADLFAQWHALVTTHGVGGFRSYDARLVAAMQTYRISRLLTFNGSDFKGLGVTIVDPTTV